MSPDTFLYVAYLFMATYDVVHGDHGCPKNLPSKCFCDKQITSVNCEGLHLTSLPSGLPKTVERLYLRHNSIDTIRSPEFGVLPNLKEVYLQNNKLIKLQQFAFYGNYTPNLQILRLDNNEIVSVEKWALHSLPVLEQLYLGNNYISIIDENAFVHCLSLKFLNLDSNKLTRIPPLGRLRSLQSLYVQANDISNATFPQQYKNLTELQTIGLSNNIIRILDDETFQALRTTNVLKLELKRNTISNISKHALEPLLQIQSLKLARNPITASMLENALVGLQEKPLRSLDITNLTLGGFLPNETFVLLRNTKINTLIMANNKINHIPDRAFADLETLSQLDLSSSGIASVADTAFDGLKTLTNLILNDNMLSDVPRNLPTTLHLLYLNGNKITALRDNAFLNLGNLRKLFLAGNQMVTLHELSFKGLVNLQTLHLVQNIISTLPGKVFNPFTRLVSLELNKNNIKGIPDEPYLFQAMKALENLNLADNDLGMMPLTLFNVLSSLTHLHLENNNIGRVMEGDREGKVFAGLHKLQSLGLTNNQISVIHDPSFRDLGNLQSLTLRQNRISGWGPHLFYKLVKLDSLDLSHNFISLVNSTSVEDLGNLQTLNLTDNPFACTCDLRWFRDWVNRTYVVVLGMSSYECNSPVEWRGKKLLSFDRTKINCLFFTLLVLLSVAGLAMIVVVIFIICAYRKRWFIRLRWHHLCRHIRKKTQGTRHYTLIPGDDRKYDAYISYAEDDWKWVFENILPDIDRGQINNREFGGNFGLYFDHRDGDPGMSYIASIVDNIEVSRKVIIILSNKYIGDARYEFELDLTMNSKLDHQIEDYIVVAMSDLRPCRVPKVLHATMMSERYIKWDEEEDAVLTNKGKLREFLEKRTDGDEV